MQLYGKYFEFDRDKAFRAEYCKHMMCVQYSKLRHQCHKQSSKM